MPLMGAGWGGGQTINKVLTAGGVYTIIVRDSSNTYTGNYALTCATAPTCGQVVTGSINTNYGKDLYAFTASANDIVTIVANKTSGDANFRPYLELYATGESSPLSSGYGPIVVTLTTAGTYTIVVRDDNNTDKGNYNLKFQKNNNSCLEVDVTGPADWLIEAGSKITITWTATSSQSISSFEIWFSTDGCVNFTVIATGLPGDTRSFEWTIPADLFTAKGCIRVIGKDATGNIVYDDSTEFVILEIVTKTYEYDKLNRLTRIAFEDGGEIIYTYDEVGNRLALTSSPPDVTTTTTPTPTISTTSSTTTTLSPITTTTSSTTTTTTTTTISTNTTTTTTTTTLSTTTTTCPSLSPKICRTCPLPFSVKQGKRKCKIFKIWNCGQGTLNWTVSEDCDWLTLSPSNGTSTRKKNKVTACVDTTGMAKGDYECTVTITGECASNSPQTCVVKLKVK